MVLDRLAKRVRRGRETSLRWAIVTSAPKGEAGEQWGDTWFARDLAAALRRAGQHARVVSRAGANGERRSQDDVVLVLRGLREVRPPQERDNTWMLWVISHPELVTEAELRAFDAVFVASESWAAPGGVSVTPLLQATEPARFTPAAGTHAGSNVLFVGSTRGEFRPAVRAALQSSRAQDLEIFGVGWAEYVEPEQIAGEFLPNDDLPAAYANAEIVLNDHHREMARDGFLSNRLFDAVAAGARVLTDRARGIEDVFGDAVVVYEDEDQLVELLAQPVESVFPDEASRQMAAERIARDHSFDVRASILIDRAEQLRGDA